MAKRNAKIVRQENLQSYLQEIPFATDEELAKHFACSIQTIRMDRLELKIPEVRERLMITHFNQFISCYDFQFIMKFNKQRFNFFIFAYKINFFQIIIIF